METEEQKKEGGEVEHVGKKLPPRHACRKEAMEHDENNLRPSFFKNE